MWVRGLKHHFHHNYKHSDQSHPMWVRGLKRGTKVYVYGKLCRTLCGCVD